LIRFFHVGFKKKSNLNQVIGLSKQCIKFDGKTLQLYSTKFQEGEKDIKFGSLGKKYKDLKITQGGKLSKDFNNYFLLIPFKIQSTKKSSFKSFCGIDLGVRTFATVCSDSHFYDYDHSQLKLRKLYQNIELLKSRRIKVKSDPYQPTKKETKSKKALTKKQILTKILQSRKIKPLRKKSLIKRETKQKNIIKQLHHDIINDVVKKNDVIFYGDIKSHDIVNYTYNTTTKKDFQMLRFYQFKERLLNTGKQKGNKIFCVNEACTTKTCGMLNDPGYLKEYYCLNCKKTVGRDEDAAKLKSERKVRLRSMAAPEITTLNKLTDVDWHRNADSFGNDSIISFVPTLTEKWKILHQYIQVIMSCLLLVKS
ncbi:hypothetical protein HK099_008531, partial [Clydaea vesicula]